MKVRIKQPIYFDQVKLMKQLNERMREVIPRPVPRPLAVDGKRMDPVLPSDLTRLNDIALGRLFGEFAAMAQWCQLQLARSGVEAAVKRKADKMERARVRLQKSGTNSDKDNKAEVDPRVRQTIFELTLAESTETLTKAVMDGYLIGRDATSREITRRIAMREMVGPEGRRPRPH